MEAIQAQKWIKNELIAAGIELAEAESEARLLLAAAMDLPLSHLPLHGREPVDQQWLWQRLKRRVQGEPLQYILGETEFMGLVYQALPQALIPRIDSEIVVEWGITLMRRMLVAGARPQIADICTGGGAFAIALAHYLPQVQVVAVDISPEALAIARENAAMNKVSAQIDFLQGDLLQPLLTQGLQVPLIIANPPYIPSGEISGLGRELAYEPLLALDGGADGLDFYRRLAAEAGAALLPGGYLLLEHGAGQRGDIVSLLQQAGWNICQLINDYGRRERGIVAVLNLPK
ncbi:MAG: peptide chain release factor N(5)-glutamine methyltransferase [Clostridiales bacterium]